MWDARQYELFRAERSRPFYDLLTRIPDRGYRTIADLGCGTGDLTEALAEHWPEAHVWGVDRSAEMLARAVSLQKPGRLEFVQADLSQWKPGRPLDLVVSNAAFQWLPDQAALLGFVVSTLTPGGVLAVQIPDNFASPSHVLLGEVEWAEDWGAELRSRPRHDGIWPVERYAELLGDLGMEVDAWTTTYQHVLPGEDAVLEWMKGTALRPLLQALGGPEQERFLALYAEKLRRAFPRTSRGTVFPFRRLFFVARKP